MPNPFRRVYIEPKIEADEARNATLQDGQRSNPRDGASGKSIRSLPARASTTIPEQQSRLPAEDAAAPSNLFAVQQRWAVERHGDMLLSRAEFTRWHKFEDADDVLAHFAIAPDKRRTTRSRTWSIVKIPLGIILIAAAAGAGANGDAILKRAREFLAPPVTASVVVAPKSAPVTGSPEAAPPVVAAAEPPVPNTVSLEEAIARTVVQIRATLPQKIDALTSMLAVANEGTRIIFENQIAADGAKIDQAKKAKILQIITANTCNTPGPRKLLDLGASFRYVYIDLKAKPVITTDVTRNNCF